MKTLIKNLLLIISSIVVINCSKDNDNAPKGYFPKKIVIDNILGGLSNSRELIFIYNHNNLITTINFDYTSGTISEESFKTIRLEYTQNNDIKEIKTTSLNNKQTTTTFNHDDFGVITSIHFQGEESNFDMITSYDPQSNMYTIDGDLANFPLEFNFDNKDVFYSISGSAVIDRNINFDNQETGPFKNLRQQPELIIWSEISTFGSLTVNLYYLYPFKIEKVNFQSLNHRIFENFERDSNDNLKSFSSRTLVAGVETNYTIEYQNRNL